MQRNAVLLVWACGLLVAVLAYAADPAALLEAGLDALAATLATAERLVRSLSVLGGDVMRALAIGLFTVFLGLGVVAVRQGAKGRAALLLVSTIFIWLVRDGRAATNGQWATAFALAAVGALVMTGRIRRGPR